MRMMGATAALAAGALAAAAAAPSAQGAVSLQRVGTFTEPVDAIGPPGDASRVFVVERAGRIQEVHGTTTTTFLDLTDRVRSSGGEQGLLSMAFAPDYATSGRFYVYYTAPPPGGGGQSDLVISELRRSDPDHGDRGSERIVLRIPHRLQGNHNGGQLQIGPDGLLWVGTGDGGGADDQLGNAQRTDPASNDAAAGHDARLGKLLRVDPTPGPGCGPEGSCTIPAGNPGFAQPEVWALGLRNPWRFSFDRATGDLVIGDVGQAAWEEIDLATAPDLGRGANYGWSTYEGAHPLGSTAPAGSPPGVVMPVLEKGHSAPDSFVAIVGGVVVRDPALPDLAGRYLYGDTSVGDVRAVTLAPGGATSDAATGLHVSTLVSFGEDACGRVYAVSLDGPVFRLAQSGDCVLPGAAPAGPAPAPAPGGGTGAARDTTAPVLTLRAGARQHPWRSGVVRLRAGCDEACTVTAGGAFVITRARGAHATVVALRTATGVAQVSAGGSAALSLKVSARVRRTLARALRRGRRVSVRFAVAAKDGAGNVGRRGASARVVRR
jgi:glucose/arabinose dehydrogenase